jgi:phage tail-like protein
MAQTGSRNDPFAAFNFVVEIDNVTVAGFSECSGLNTETDAIEYRNGNSDITVTKLPGLKKFGNITLKHGYTADRSLWEWRKKVLDGKTERQNGSVVLLDEGAKEAIRWNFYEAWPRKLDFPTLNAKTNEVAIETLEIVCERIEQA